MQGNLLFIYFKALFEKKTHFFLDKTTKIGLKICLPNKPLSEKSLYKKDWEPNKDLPIWLEFDSIELTWNLWFD